MQNNINEKNGTIIVKRTLNHLKAKAKGVVLIGALCAGAIIWARSCMVEDKMCEIKCPQGTELVWHSKKDIELRQNIKGKILSLPNICDEKENSKCGENVPVCEETKPVVAPSVVTQPVAHRSPPKKPICGDGKCEKPKENVNNCAEDCGKCGDGVISRSIGEKCEPPNRGCGPDEKCIGCRTCTPKPEHVVIKTCDPIMISDGRERQFRLAAKRGIKSMASTPVNGEKIAGLSVEGTVDYCIKGRKAEIVSLKFSKEVDGKKVRVEVNPDLLRRVKSAIIAKVRAVEPEGVDMRFTFKMDNIRE